MPGPVLCLGLAESGADEHDQAGWRGWLGGQLHPRPHLRAGASRRERAEAGMYTVQLTH